jgi:hypothetical protein
MSLFFRSVGSKGTSVDFIPTKDGLKCIAEDSGGQDEDFLSTSALRKLLKKIEKLEAKHNRLLGRD